MDYTQFPPVSRPLLHVTDGESVVFTYSRFPMAGFKGRKRNPALPPATSAQVEAMDTVQYYMSQNAVPLPWTRGDIAFINDMAVMHARSGFKEQGAPGTGQERHLLKFYLRDPAQNWPVPETARKHWNKIYGANTPDGRREEEWSIHYEPGQEDGWESNG